MKVKALILIGLLVSQTAFAKRVKTLRLSDESVVTVPVSTRGAVLSFPSKPANVILGAQGKFGIEYVGSDLAISPLSNVSRANLFVYLAGRRFNLDLIASSKGYTLVIIKDKSSGLVEVKSE